MLAFAVSASALRAAAVGLQGVRTGVCSLPETLAEAANAVQCAALRDGTLGTCTYVHTYVCTSYIRLAS